MTPALFNAPRSCVVDRNGTPAASSVVACCCTDAGTSGLFSIPEMIEVVKVAMSTDPISAVPREAPRLVAVFCSPPTSALCESGTAETVIAPS